jgi:ketosteroid isomerase-like protein
MTRPISRDLVEVFFEAFASRDPARIAPYIHEDVDWVIYGPVELLPFCGRRRGKKAVMEIFERLVPDVMDIKSVVREHFLVDGDSAALFSRVSAQMRGSGRVLGHRIAQFWQFRDGQILVNRTLIDSFDAAEQVLGHPLDVFGLDRVSARADLVVV